MTGNVGGIDRVLRILVGLGLLSLELPRTTVRQRGKSAPSRVELERRLIWNTLK